MRYVLLNLLHTLRYDMVLILIIAIFFECIPLIAELAICSTTTVCFDLQCVRVV